MKRTALTRRSAMPRQRKPLPRVSAKNARAIRQIAPGRKEFREKFGHCMWCGSFNQKLDIHEILPGRNRAKAYQRRECWLLLCREPCHRTVQNLSLAKQLFIKLEADPLWFDLDVIREIYGGGTLITMADIRNIA